MTYGRLARFLLPLAVTAIVLELGQQVLSAGMARVPQATQTLAAYGLAWGLVLFLTSPLGQAKELGLVLVNSEQSWRMVRRFVLVLGFALVCAMAALTLGPIEPTRSSRDCTAWTRSSARRCGWRCCCCCRTRSCAE